MLNHDDIIPGFTHPGSVPRFRRRRSAILAELVATLALVIAIAVTVFVVGMEMAEAGALKSVHHAGGHVAFAALLGFVVASTGSLAALAAVVSTRRKH